MELVDLNDSRGAIEKTKCRLSKKSFGIWPAKDGPESAIHKYSPILCLLEALAIFLVVLYLLSFADQRQPPPPSNSYPQYSQPDTSDVASKGKSCYRIFSTSEQTEASGNQTTRRTKKILVGLVPNCNQRIHDKPYGVKCVSADAQICRGMPPESIDPRPDVRRKVSYTTSMDGLRFKDEVIDMESIVFKDDAEWATRTTLTIFTDQQQQEIIGWGGALTDSSINNILSLTTNGTRRLLDDYFGSEGLRFNMIRVTIGGSDFSSRFYTNDDLDPKNKTAEDLDLTNFKLREEDLLYKIPMLKFIKKTYEGDIKLFASMWSPPIWMKTNHHFNKGFMKGNISRSKLALREERYFSALADLKRKFLLAYKENNITFWGLTVMNEPFFAVQPFLNFNTMIFPQQDYASYIAKYLGPALKDDKRFDSIVLMAHDDNRRYLKSFTEPVLASRKAMQYLDGVSVHGYIDEDYHQMDRVYGILNSWNSKNFVLPTELCSGHLPFMEKALVGNWHRGMHYALDIIRSLQHSAAGWVDWNMVLDTSGGPGWLGGRLDSPVIVDKEEDSYYKSPMFYALGHFSRYIPPGSVRLNSSILNDDYDYHLETVTFKAPGFTNRLITVVVNNNPYPVTIYIGLASKSASKSEKYLAQKFRANSITTWIL